MARLSLPIGSIETMETLEHISNFSRKTTPLHIAITEAIVPL